MKAVDMGVNQKSLPNFEWGMLMQIVSSIIFKKYRSELTKARHFKGKKSFW